MRWLERRPTLVAGAAGALLLLVAVGWTALVYAGDGKSSISCTEPPEVGPRLPVMPAFEGPPEEVASRFAQAFGVDLGPPTTPPPTEDASEPTWKFGEGTLSIRMHGDVHVELRPWLSGDQAAAGAAIEGILNRLGLDDTVTPDPSRAGVFLLAQPSPIGPVASGTVYTGDYGSFDLGVHYQMPTQAEVTLQEAVETAAAYEDCRRAQGMEQRSLLERRVAQPTVAGGLLGFVVEFVYERGVPFENVLEGNTYVIHGCTEGKTVIVVHATTGRAAWWSTHAHNCR